MAKFEIFLEITGLKLQVKGNRDDVVQMTEAVSQQVAGLLSPAAQIVEGEVVDQNVPALPAPAPTTNKPRKRRVASKTTAIDKTPNAVVALDWINDPSKWGVPSQSWVTAEKAIWLLYVVGQELKTTEMSSQVISATFNKHFKQSGTITTGNVTRDLGKLKVSKGGTPAVVSENTTVEPTAWFLTQEGDKQAQKLVVKAKGQSEEPKQA